jgi:ABC transporter substrate binding protein
MNRRDVITVLGGAAAWPLAAHAQQPERMRRIGVLTNLAADDAVARARIGAFQQALWHLGWSEGGNLRTDYRWTVGGIDELRRYAAELIALAPEVIMATGSPPVVALRNATRTIPIVFALVADPVGVGFVESLARPGGNATGFTPFEYSIGAKWLELLREGAPHVRRVRGEAGRHSGRAADQVRPHHQSDGSQGARSRYPANPARPRRRGDRMKRRTFIAGLAGAMAGPLAARAQQSAKLPTIRAAG